jgi:hypothetical protein
MEGVAMTDQAKGETKPTGLALLRVPFPDHQISKLPKPTKSQTDAVKADFKKGIRCKLCGAWHHPDVVHLDYVGHAALTSRLLDCDPQWNWEPIAADDAGLPLIDANGGMWIKLTVCDVSRLGYGHADGKRGGDAIKEVIGDALRNAAMRFGAALDLWHKGDLHGEMVDDGEWAKGNGKGQTDNREPPRNVEPEAEPDKPRIATIVAAKQSLQRAVDLPRLKAIWESLPKQVQTWPGVLEEKDARKTQLAAQEPPSESAAFDDEIPY